MRLGDDKAWIIFRLLAPLQHCDVWDRCSSVRLEGAQGLASITYIRSWYSTSLFGQIFYVKEKFKKEY